MIVCTTNMQHATPAKPVTLNDGWNRIAALLSHVEEGLFGPGSDHPVSFDVTMYTEAHNLVYTMCTQKPSLCPDLYRRFGIHAADVAREAYANRKRD